MPHKAAERQKHIKRREKMFGLPRGEKIRYYRMECAYCGCSRFPYISVCRDYEAHAQEDFPPGFLPDILIKCPACKNQIGFRITEHREAVEQPIQFNEHIARGARGTRLQSCVST